MDCVISVAEVAGNDHICPCYGGGMKGGNERSVLRGWSNEKENEKNWVMRGVVGGCIMRGGGLIGRMLVRCITRVLRKGIAKGNTYSNYDK